MTPNLLILVYHNWKEQILKYQRLTREERYQIGALRKSGLGLRAIGATLSRHPSTISREIRRNYTAYGYCPQIANARARERRSGIHPPIKVQGQLAKRVAKLLQDEWSPEQISGRLRTQEKIKVSHESIYSYIYRDFKARGSIYLNLRRKRKMRRSRATGRAFKRCGKRLSYPAIKKRPAIVERRERLGDYERDTVLGKFKGPVLLTVVDRSSRLTKIRKVNKMNAHLTHLKTVAILRKMPKHTITNDNGPEFADYAKTAKSLKAEVFFNDPYASWQRGTNENTNGLIRQYFPKGTDFTKVTDREIRRVEHLLNNRPRKCLGYKTPLEVQNSKSQVLH